MEIKEINQLKKEIENILNDNKASEIISINLKDKTSIADFMVIASGSSSRHIQALSEILLDRLKKKGINNCRLEGRDSGDWKLIDAKDIIIHIFHQEKRSLPQSTPREATRVGWHASQVQKRPCKSSEKTKLTLPVAG